MSYIQLSVADKIHRNTQINNDLGITPYLCVYQGAIPLSPDITTASGNLLAALACSDPFGVISYFVQNASVNAGGSGGSNGSQVVTGTTGTGTKFQAVVTVTGGAITAVTSISVAGSYSVLPPSLVAEPVTGASLTGASLSLQMSSILTGSTITANTALASGTAAYARLAPASTAGGAGIVDLDVGTSGTSVIINTTTLVSGGPVACTGATIAEA